MLRKTLAIVLSALVTTACSYTGQPIKVPPPNQMPTRVTDADIVIGAESYTSQDKAERTFGERVAPRYLPVLVSVQNDTDEHVLVNKSKAALLSADGKLSKPVGWQTMYRAFKGDAVGSALAFGAIGASKTNEKNDAMAEDWRNKELPDEKTLAPGEGVGGFVYFKSKRGKPPYTLLLAVEKLKSSETVKAELELE